MTAEPWRQISEAAEVGRRWGKDGEVCARATKLWHRELGRRSGGEAVMVAESWRQSRGGRAVAAESWRQSRGGRAVATEPMRQSQ